MHGCLVRQADLALFIAEKVHGKALALTVFQHGVNRPVFFRAKSADLFFPVHDNAGGHRLHAAGRKAVAHRFPEIGREFIAHHPVPDTAGLLGVDQIHVNGTRLLDRSAHHGGRNLVESDAQSLFGIQPQRAGQMPGNGLPFAVRVGREIDFFGGLGFFFDLFDEVALAADVDVMRLKTVLNIHAERALGQVAHMTLGGDDFIVGAEIFFNGGCFGRGFYQICHVNFLSKIQTQGYFFSYLPPGRSVRQPESSSSVSAGRIRAGEKPFPGSSSG